MVDKEFFRTSINAGMFHLNSLYTFENFVVGERSRLAYDACLAIAKNPGKEYNPLLISGTHGLGKTHLLHAIGNLAVDKGIVNREGICYVTAETFFGDLIKSLQYECMDDFRDMYRKTDMLLFDDVQFVAGKERTQAELLHTFNSLYDRMIQIVITSSVLPKNIENLEKGLASRFDWGLAVNLQPPDIETKVAIIRKKAETRNMILPDDIIQLLASRSGDDIRSLERLLNTVAFVTSSGNVPISDELVRKITELEAGKSA